MKIIADAHIPYLALFAPYGELITKNGRDITADDIRDADALLIRTITPVTRALLTDTAVRFIGSMTAGDDHIDYAACHAQDVTAYVAFGCNATAVAQYVTHCLHVLGIHHGRIAVIGVGHVGSRVVAKLKDIGFTLIENDPPRALRGFNSDSLDDIRDVDAICLHTPLTHHGPFPTYHLINANVLKRQRPGTALISAGRGAVVDFSALREAGQHLRLCIDVWEGEPEVDTDILMRAAIATPHIAGYSQQAKYRATTQVLQAFQHHFHLPHCAITLPVFSDVTLDLVAETQRFRDAWNAHPAADTFDRLRHTFALPSEK